MLRSLARHSALRRNIRVCLGIATAVALGLQDLLAADYRRFAARRDRGV